MGTRHRQSRSCRRPRRFFRPGLEQLEGRRLLATYVVNTLETGHWPHSDPSNPDDSDSLLSFDRALRLATRNAYPHPEPVSIRFAVTGTIKLDQSYAYDVTETVDIQGSTGPNGSPAVTFDALRIGCGGSKNVFSGIGIVNGGLTLANGQGSTISRCVFDGSTLTIMGSSENVVTGSRFGTDSSGMKEGEKTRVGGIRIISNGFSGPSQKNVIGGSAPGAGNLISCSQTGISVEGEGATGTIIQGNLIGTDATGVDAGLPVDYGPALAMGNYTGIGLYGAQGTMIGGLAPGAGNVIAGNGTGIAVSTDRWTHAPSRNTTIQGNLVGVGIGGKKSLPNFDGIHIYDAPNTLIGGTVAGAGNVIANSVKSADGDGTGVTITGNAATGNRILGNPIYGNEGPGIDLGGDGPTKNDSKGHSGPGGYQNFPTVARAADGSFLVSLSASPAKTYRVELFASATGGTKPSPAQGIRFLAARDVTTDSKGDASFTFPSDPTAATIVATATSPEGNTSEFTIDPPASGPLAVSIVPSLERLHPGQIITVDVTVVARAGSTNTMFTLNAPPGTTLLKDFKKVPSVSFQAAGDRLEASFGLEVNDVKDLPAGLKSFVLSAAASTKLANGTTATQTQSTTLTLDAELDVTVTPSLPAVRPKDQLAYTIVVDAQDKGGPFTVRATVPTGTAVVAGSIRDGGRVETTLGKSSVVWTLPAGEQAETGFTVKVKDRADLPPAPVRLESAVTASVIVDGKQVAGTGTSQVLVSNFAVQGKVFDTVLDFPNKTFVDTSRPLAGVTVRLLDAKGAVVDTTTADAKGQYAVAALKAGSYTVEISTSVSVYDKTQPTLGPADFKQRRTVSFAADQLVPKSLDDVLMPVSLLNRAATLVDKLHKFTVPPTVGGLFNFFGNLVSFELGTTTCETLLRRTINQSSQKSFAGIYTDKGAGWITSHPGSHLAAVRDDYNACIRLTAVMELLVKRFDRAGSPDHDDDITLADQFAKTTALLITLQGMRLLGKMKAFPNPSLDQLYVRALKIEALGDELGRFMPRLLNRLSEIDPRFKDPTTQAQVREFVYKAARIYYDWYSGQLKEDAVFEAAFDTLRAGLLQGYLELGLRGDLLGLPGSQAALSKAADLAIRNVISGDTFETLAAMESQDAAMSDRYKHIIGVGSDSLKFINVLRLTEGLTASAMKIRARGVDAATAKGLLAGLDKLGEVTEKVTAAPYILTLGLPLAELFSRSADLQAISGLAMSGPVDSKSASPLPSLSETQPAAPASPASTTASTDYATQLTEMQRLVNNDDGKGVAAAQPTLQRLETAMLTSHWTLLDRRAAAALSGRSPDAAQVAPLAAFRALLPAVERGVARFNMYLHLWSDASSPAERAFIRDAITPLVAKLRADLIAAGNAEPAAAAALAATTVPGFLIVTPSEDPVAIEGGGMAKLIFDVTNVGQRPTVAGTASLKLGTGATIQGTANLPLPAVAAGATRKLTWTVRAGRPQTDDFVSYQIQVAPKTGLTNSSEDSLLVRATVPTIPTAVGIIAAASGDGRVTLSWSAPDSDGGRPVGDYKVEYTADLGKTWTAFVHTASAATALTVTGLANGTSYYFRVSAINDRGTSQPRTTPLPSTPRTVPGAPGPVTAVGGTGKATVSWTAPASTGGARITDYRIESSLDAGKTWTAFTHPVSAATSISVIGLTKGKTYLFRVAAINEAGAGATRQSAAPVTVS